MACDHKTFLTREAAEEALEHDIARFKRNGKGGKSWKRLNVYPCGNHFHIGRANQFHWRPAPAPKPATRGDLLRKLERMAESWQRHDDHLRRQRLAELGRIIAAEQAVQDSQSEYVLGTLAELTDSIALAAQLFSRPR